MVASSSRAFLELDPIVGNALGGSDDVANSRVRCRAHNRLHAEQVFGREHVQRQISLRQRKRTPARADELVRPPAFETAERGLRNLGFRDGEVRRALEALRAKLGPSASPDAILREALRILT